jgi:hypothetical protein
MSTRDAGSPSPAPGPATNLPADAFDMLKRMWGMAGMGGVPGMPSAVGLSQQVAQMTKGVPPMMPNLLVPTFDVDELDKRITDLRAVEQWLQLNAALLRTTIQTLEMQRTTLASMQQFGGAMFASMQGTPAAGTPPDAAPGDAAATESRPRTPARKPASNAGTAASPALDPTAWWNTLQQQFTQIAEAAAAGAQPGAAAQKPDARKRKRG